MKPDITPERLYNNADMTQVRDLDFVSGCYRLIRLLAEASIHENTKPTKVPSGQMVWSIDKENWNIPFVTRSFHLQREQDTAMTYWRGIIKMVTKLKGEE